MKNFTPVLILFSTGCALPPAEIASGIDECKEYDLVPVVSIRRDAVVNVNCVPDQDSGYILIERDLGGKLIEVPKPRK